MPWFLGAHHVSNFAEIGRLIEFLVWGSGYSCFTWPLYIAIEPYVRRRWPVTLISWSRLLAGGIRDPLVGRDVLVGALAAASIDAVGRVWWFIPSWLSHPPTQPFSGQFLGAHTIIASISDTLKNAPLSSLAAVCARSSPRVAAQGVGGNVRIRSFADGLPLSVERAPPEFVVFYLILCGLLAFLLIRRGLLCIVAFFVFDYVNSSFPLTPKGAWYAGMSLAGILLMATLAVYAFHTPWVADRFSEAVRA